MRRFLEPPELKPIQALKTVGYACPMCGMPASRLDRISPYLDAEEHPDQGGPYCTVTRVDPCGCEHTFWHPIKP
jgi:hypothetical protein